MVMSRYPKIAKSIIEVILGRKVREIISINREQSLQNSLDYKGVRLDVYLENEEEAYVVEMQTVRDKNLALRMRYYQSMVDYQSLLRGQGYVNLKPTYIIFICLFDPFGLGKAKYVIKNIIDGESTSYDDKSAKIVLNIKGDITNLDSKLVEFIHYVDKGLSSSEWIQDIQNAVDIIGQGKEWEELRMTVGEKIELVGRVKYEEGVLKSRASVLEKLIAEGMPEDEAKQRVDELIPLEETSGEVQIQ